MRLGTVAMCRERTLVNEGSMAGLSRKALFAAESSERLVFALCVGCGAQMPCLRLSQNLWYADHP